MDKEDSDFAEGDIDSLGERYIVNKDSQNRFHANWLNMMYARLVIAKDLLAEDGVICISIGENENTNISKICDEIFGEKSLVADMIWQKKTGASDAVNIACITEDDGDAIYMDFFAGSSTTAHAVIKLNATDNGNRKFVLVQLPEKCEEKSDAYKSGYKNICEIGKERIRRAGDMIRKENPEADIDIGFKVFRVANTNIKWNSLMDAGQLDMTQMEYNPDLVE